MVAQLRDHVVGLREAVVGLYGAAAPAVVGMRWRTPNDPLGFVRYAREIVAGLRDNPLPPPRVAVGRMDAEREAADLEREALAVESSLLAVAEDVRENEQTKTARDEARVGFDRTYSTVTRLLASLFAFAGEPELTDRVRPPARCSSQELAPTPSPGEAGAKG